MSPQTSRKCHRQLQYETDYNLSFLQYYEKLSTNILHPGSVKGLRIHSGRHDICAPSERVFHVATFDSTCKMPELSANDSVLDFTSLGEGLFGNWLEGKQIYPKDYTICWN
jgi:hypothetical protein